MIALRSIFMKFYADWTIVDMEIITQLAWHTQNGHTMTESHYTYI